MSSLEDICRRTAACERVDRGEIEPFLKDADPQVRHLARGCLAVRGLLETADLIQEDLEETGYADAQGMQRLFAVCRLANDEETVVRSGFAAGLAAVRRSDDGLGLEILQMAAYDDIRRGIRYLGDTARAAEVAQVYDTVAARHVPLAPVSARRVPGGRIRIGYVVPNLVDDVNAPSRRIVNFAKYHDRSRFEMFVYSSEVLCRRQKTLYFRFQNAASTSQRAPKMLRTFAECDIPFFATPPDGTFIDAAKALATRMRDDALDVACYESSLACPVECLVADWRLAPVQVNINVGVPMYVEGIDCTTYFMRKNQEREAAWFASRGKRTLFLDGGIDLDLKLPPVPKRSDCGISEDAVVLVTVGNHLARRMSAEFVGCITRVMRANPGVIYLVIGSGDFAGQKRQFHEGGVLGRAVFTGASSEVRHIIRLADVYVNEFPEGGAQSVMEAMAAGIPAVAMRYSDQHLHCCGAEYVGDEMTVAGRDFDGYVELVNRLVHDADFRRRRGAAARRRVEELYSFRKCVDRFESLYAELVEQAAVNVA